jgi:hypothetical protein
MAQKHQALRQLNTKIASADDPLVARQVQVGAMELQYILQTSDDYPEEAERMWWQCEHLVRDVSKRPTLERSLAIVDYWRRAGDPVYLARTAIAHIRLSRTRNGDLWGKPKCEDAMLLQHALDMLSHSPAGHEPVVMESLRFLTLLWKYRVIALFGKEPEHAQKERESMQSLAQDLQFPMILREATREEAYHQLLLGNINQAEACLEQCRQLRGQIPAPESNAPPGPAEEMSFLTPEIEILLHKPEIRQATERIQRYLELCYKLPNHQNIRHLKRWVSEYNLRAKFPTLPTPQFSFPVAMTLHWGNEEWKASLGQ